MKKLSVKQEIRRVSSKHTSGKEEERDERVKEVVGKHYFFCFVQITRSHTVSSSGLGCQFYNLINILLLLLSSGFWRGGFVS